MKKQTDTDIREALRRKEAKRQPVEVPDDFLDNVMDEIEQQPKSIKIWRYVAVAAGIALLISIGATIFVNDGKQEPEQMTASIEDTISNVTTITDSTKTVIAADDTLNTESIKPQKSEPIVISQSEPGTIKNTEPQNADTPKQQVKKNEPEKQQHAEQTIAEANTNHVAEAKDYVSPAALDDLISRMANYQGADLKVLDCATEQDSSATEWVYIFPENSGDIIGRLIMSATKFNDDSDGYFLNYSQQQFFFTLNDERTGQNYLWIAEKTGDGKIVLYSSHNGINNISDCYQSYHNKLMYNNMNTYNRI